MQPGKQHENRHHGHQCPYPVGHGRRHVSQRRGLVKTREKQRSEMKNQSAEDHGHDHVQDIFSLGSPPVPGGCLIPARNPRWIWRCRSPKAPAATARTARATGSSARARTAPRRSARAGMGHEFGGRIAVRADAMCDRVVNRDVSGAEQPEHKQIPLADSYQASPNCGDDCAARRRVPSDDRRASAAARCRKASFTIGPMIRLVAISPPIHEGRVTSKTSLIRVPPPLSSNLCKCRNVLKGHESTGR